VAFGHWAMCIAAEYQDEYMSSPLYPFYLISCLRDSMMEEWQLT
jgi:hypothetical protein